MYKVKHKTLLTMDTSISLPLYVANVLGVCFELLPDNISTDDSYVLMPSDAKCPYPLT